MIEENNDEKLEIEEEYKVWKKNTPFLYDLVLTRSLEWPSLTVSWLKTKHDESNFYSRQDLILGTQTSDQETNYLILGQIKIPKKNLESTAEYNKAEKKVNLVTKIPHEGEINKARANPDSQNLIATKSSNGLLYLIDSDKHTGNESNSAVQYKLSGHNQEGYGLNWNNTQSNLLASGSDDKLICVWDINGKSQEGTLAPIHTFSEHQGIVEDVCFSPKDPFILISVSDDKYLKL